MAAVRSCVFASVGLSLVVSGCGITTPKMALSSDPQATSDIVLRVVNHVDSELGCAINDLIAFDRLNATSGRAFPWLDDATVKVSLKLTADEKSSVNPSAVVTEPLNNAVATFGQTVVTNGQSFTLPINLGGSSEATRIDNSDYSFSVKDVFLANPLYEPKGVHCATPYDGLLVDSDLHIKDWLDSRLRIYVTQPDVKKAAPDTLTTEITFIVAASGNATPTWRLIPVSYNAGSSPFFETGRTQTDDVIITISATKEKAEAAQNIAKTTSGFSTALNGVAPGH
jgi:hypothetical protein